MTQHGNHWATVLGRDPAPEEALVFNHIVSCARATAQVERVLLFGSRSRGTHTPRSDFDFALEWRPGSTSWGAFCHDLTESLPTVHSIDVLDLATVSVPLRERILTEAKELMHA